MFNTSSRSSWPFRANPKINKITTPIRMMKIKTKQPNAHLLGLSIILRFSKKEYRSLHKNCTCKTCRCSSILYCLTSRNTSDTDNEMAPAKPHILLVQGYVQKDQPARQGSVPARLNLPVPLLLQGLLRRGDFLE